VTQGTLPEQSSQPSGLGFFNFLQLTNGAVRQSPVTVGVHFNVGAATIDTTSFHAELNGQDVTSQFTPTGSGSDLSATFNTPGSPLISGTDVLQGMVSGTPTGGTSSETDLNYIRFYVNTTRPLDLKGGRVVNCLDLAIVKASFGKKTGQPGFDPRADVETRRQPACFHRSTAIKRVTIAPKLFSAANYLKLSLLPFPAQRSRLAHPPPMLLSNPLTAIASYRRLPLYQRIAPLSPDRTKPSVMILDN